MKIATLFKATSAFPVVSWTRKIVPEGVNVLRAAASGSELLLPQGIGGVLTQLYDDGLAQVTSTGYLIDWDSLNDACSRESYNGLPIALALPERTTLRPRLSSKGALTDKDFSISLGPWVDGNGQLVFPEYVGAAIRQGDKLELMTPEQWGLFKGVKSFAQRDNTQRNDLDQRLFWGHIRRMAVAADAVMDDFLIKTVILTPERIDLGFRKSEAVTDDSVIEIMPGFEGAPPDWIEQFDRHSNIPARYDLTEKNGGLLQVLISPEARTVLEQIKRLPGRRIAGSRAQAFLVNPFATLGEDAAKVIDEAQFEAAKASAGVFFERFMPIVEYDETGFPEVVGISFEGEKGSESSTSERLTFSDVELKRFIGRLQHAIANGHQLLFWEGHEFEVLPEAETHLAILQTALFARSKPRTLISYDTVHDLSGYSSRIEGLGVDKPYYSPFIAKKRDEDGWFPSNIERIITYTPQGADAAIAIPVDEETLGALAESMHSAEHRGDKDVSLPNFPQPIPIGDARQIVETFNLVDRELKDGKFQPEKVGAGPQKVRKGLILRSNIDTIDYEEQRVAALKAQAKDPKVPRSLARDASLLDHQREGVARLQQLYALRESQNVRGMLLADDMGLGKTLQLLTLMASILEDDSNCLPMLVVAPVSLLENWTEEAEKFYPSALPILMAYGSKLASLRVPRESIDERLRNEDGLVKFLRPNWIGDAKIVLTTYETLRDLEFSFALQPWSLMVCDEAQRVKNPAAMVTRAAKKQKAAFKIACTGTPVENTLADLWCLFDFIQPGLLGSLNEFGRRYRRPIEIDDRDEAGRQRVDELRTLIEPQILRRTKLEVAKDLPKKVVVNECRRLPLSLQQRNLYAKAIDDFKNRSDPNSRSPFKNNLGLLFYLRLICTDPKRYGLTVFKPEPIDHYRKASPKLDWLLEQLRQIQKKEEKAIIFCEFRNIQRLLQHYLAEALKLEVDIINGDTAATETSAASRQKRIKAFQARPGFGVIVLSPLAVGFGVNIQAANHVIHYTRTWNPAKEDQASDRAWRIGQVKDVYVYYPVVAADDFTTFDVKLDQLLDRKRALAGDMLNGCPDVSPADFQIQDVVPVEDAQEMDEFVTIDMAMRMEWRHFEGLIAALWKRRGFDFVYCTPSGGDNGVDVVAIKGSSGELIQTKTSAADDRSLSWDAVKEVVAGEAFYKRRHPDVTFRKIGVTNQFFNSSAHEKAALNEVELLDQTDLQVLLRDWPVTMLEIEKYLFCDWTLG